MFTTISNSLLNPTGIAFDSSGSLYVSSMVNSSGPFPVPRPAITKFSSSGTAVGQIFTDVGATTLDAAAVPTKLEFSPELGSLLSLSVDGSLLVIDPNTFTTIGSLDLKSLPIDTSAIFDIATNTIDNFGGLIQPQFSSYGDFDIRISGSKTQLFVAGLSQAQAFPFVLRVEFQNGIVNEAKIIFSSRADTLSFARQTPRLTRGIAVNSQGSVLTTLPILPASRQVIDVPVAFSADFNAQDGLSQGEGPVVFADTDVYSQGLTTDSSDNFYITTNSVGSGSLGVAGEGALIAISANFRFISAQKVELLSSFQDVAIFNNIPFVVGSTFPASFIPDDFLVSFPSVTTTAVRFSAIGLSANIDDGELSPQTISLKETSLDNFSVTQASQDDYRNYNSSNYLASNTASQWINSEADSTTIPWTRSEYAWLNDLIMIEGLNI
jgi:hypothetical protein